MEQQTPQVDKREQLRRFQEAKKRMREELAEVKMQAEYWKAVYEMRYYTIEAERTRLPYEEHLEKVRKDQEAQLKAREEALNKIIKEAEDKTQNEKPAEITPSSAESNPEVEAE